MARYGKYLYARYVLQDAIRERYPMGIQLDGRTIVESAVDVGRVEPRREIELRFARTGITKGR